MSEPRTPKEKLPEFVVALSVQLDDDAKRWGETWLHRSRAGQEDRCMEHINSYFDQFKGGGVPIPWLKIAGLSLIAWIREQPGWVEPGR